MKAVKIITVIIFSVCFNACEKGAIDAADDLHVFKFRGDYSRNIFVMVNEERTQISAIPDPKRDSTVWAWPQELELDYWLNGIGFNPPRTVVTSVKIEDYKEHIPADSLFELIIDFDPFLEYYICSDRSKFSYFYNDNGLDTLKLIEVIEKGELKNYFRKII